VAPVIFQDRIENDKFLVVQRGIFLIITAVCQALFRPDVAFDAAALACAFRAEFRRPPCYMIFDERFVVTPPGRRSRARNGRASAMSAGKTKPGP
jgi:hypothetical protein